MRDLGDLAEGLRDMIRDEVQKTTAMTKHPRLATVESFDPDTHTAKVKYQPGGQLSGWLPIGTHQASNGSGHSSPHSPGDQVLVQFQEGAFGAGIITYAFYSKQDQNLGAKAGETIAKHKDGHGHSIKNDKTYTVDGQKGAQTVHDADGNVGHMVPNGDHHFDAKNAKLTKGGDLSNEGSHTAKSDITSSQGNVTASKGNVSAPSGTVSGLAGQFAGGHLGNIGFGGGCGGFSCAPGSNGSLAVNNDLVAAPVVQSNAAYTVAQLNAEMPPTPALMGTRAVVTDALSNDNFTDPNDPSATPQPTVRFMSVLNGGGVLKAPAWCSGTAWLAA